MKPVQRHAVLLLLALFLAGGCARTAERERLAQEGLEAGKAGDYPKAIARWTEVIRLDPKSGQAYLQRAAAYESTGKIKLAIEDYSAYLQLPAPKPGLRDLLEKAGIPRPPSNDNWVRGQAFCRRAHLYARQWEFEKALADLDEARRLIPTHPWPYVLRAQIYEMKREPDRALDFYSLAIRAEPGNASTYIARGLCYSRQGKPKAALADLDKAVELDSQSAKALVNRSLLRARHGRMEAALADLDEAVRVAPAEPETYIARGGLLTDKGDYPQALKDLNYALELRPNHPVAVARRGVVLWRQGDLNSGLADLDKAISLNPAEAAFYWWRAIAFSQTNNLARALADLDKAIELNAGQPDFYQMRGSIFSRQKKYASAAAEFDRALEADPGHAGALNDLAWLLATCPDKARRDGNRAVQLATRACVARGFKDPNTVDTLAAAFAEAGEFEKAVEYQKQALDLATEQNLKRLQMVERLSRYQAQKAYREINPP